MKETPHEVSPPVDRAAAEKKGAVDERPPLKRRRKEAVILKEKPALELEDNPKDLSDDPDGCPSNLLNLDLAVAKTLSEWTEHVKAVFKVRSTFADLGRHLMSIAQTMPTPFGNFVRSYCLAAQPPTSKGGHGSGHGDLLPIPPWAVTTEVDGVTNENLA